MLLAGKLIAIVPLCLMFLGVTAWSASDARGRRAAALIFGATTLIALVIAFGLYLADNPAWLTGVAVMVGLDVLVAAVSVVMAYIERRRIGANP